MPHLSVNIGNQDVDSETRVQILLATSKLVADISGKPEKVVQIQLNTNTSMLFGGGIVPSAFCSYRQIGKLSDETRKSFVKGICTIFESLLKIGPSKVFITFETFEADHWGWDSTLVSEIFANEKK